MPVLKKYPEVPRLRAGASAHDTPTADGLLSLVDVEKRFVQDDGEVRGLHGLSFTVAAGEFAFITGPTGHGKTSALRLIRRQMAVDSGGIFLGGHNIRDFRLSDYKRRIGFVAQGLDTLPLSTVEENIAMPLQYLRWHPQRIRQRVDELLLVFSLQHARKRLGNDEELSGGERQRLAIARAVAHEPDLLLCDEPTGNLDAETTYGVLRTLNRLSMLGTTVLCVTHDPQVVDLMKKRVIVIRNGQLASDTIGGYRLR